MGFKEVIVKYKNWFVIGGLGLGALSFIDFLPVELPIVLGSTNIFYAGLILFAGYVFYSNFMNNKQGVSFERSVPNRNLGSSSLFKREIERQRGPVNKPAINRRVVNDERNIRPSNSILEKFNEGRD